MATERALLLDFAAEQERRGLSRRTILGRRRTLVAFFHSLGDTPAVGATRQQVVDWLDGCDLVARSRYTYMSTLRAFYEWALEVGHAVNDPTKGMRRPRLPRGVPRPIGGDDLAEALHYADPRMRALLCLGAYQGLRTIEMAALVREDVLDGHTPPMLLVRGKGNKERVLPLHGEVHRVLRMLPMPKRGPLFRLNDGRPMKAATLGSYIALHLHDLGIAASAHSLRHHFGSEVYRLSRDIRLTQELLGHADPKTTAIYAAWSPVEAVDVMARLGAPATAPAPP